LEALLFSLMQDSYFLHIRQRLRREGSGEPSVELLARLTTSSSSSLS